MDECFFIEWTIVQRMDNQMSSFSAKPGKEEQTKTTKGTLEDPNQSTLVTMCEENNAISLRLNTPISG